MQNHPIDVDDAIMSVKYIEITVDSSKGLSRFINQLIVTQHNNIIMVNWAWCLVYKG